MSVCSLDRQPVSEKRYPGGNCFIDENVVEIGEPNKTANGKCIDIGRFQKLENTPKWMVKIMEKPIKVDDLGVPAVFSEPPHIGMNTIQLHLINRIHVCFFVSLFTTT